MSEETYEVGELVEADVIVSGKMVRILLTFIPDDAADEVPWRALVPNSTGGWFTSDDLANVRRMVAVPRVTRQQVVEAVTAPVTPTSTTTDAVMRLFGQAE